MFHGNNEYGLLLSRKRDWKSKKDLEKRYALISYEIALSDALNLQALITKMLHTFSRLERTK